MIIRFFSSRVMVAFLMLLLLVFIAPHLFSQAATLTKQNNLLLADTPFVYGEDSFISRIKERAQGREPIGLVLSGGSARAFAHIGVLQRLEEEGLVPDFIVTNSMGSIVGLLYAAGFSPAQIEYLMSSTNLSSLVEPVFPLQGGLLDPSRFTEFIRVLLGDLSIEDMPIPILVSCEDLRTKRAVHIMEGAVQTVLEASYALPVYFPPVTYKDHLLIDSGITNLVPLGIAMQYSSSVIVSSTFYDSSNLNLANPLVVLNTSLDISKRRTGVSELLEHPEAIWIRCDVEKYSFMAFDCINNLIADGYRSAEAVSEKFVALPRGAIDQNLLRIRANWSKKIKEAYAVWNPFNWAPPDPYFGISLNLDSTAYPGDSYYLSDELMATSGVAVRLGILDLSLAAGGSWNPYAGTALNPVVAGDVALYLRPWLRLISTARGIWSQNQFHPEMYHRSGIEAVLVSGASRTRLNTALEERYNSERVSLLSTEAGYTYIGDSRIQRASLRTGHQVSAWADHALWARLESSLMVIEPVVFNLHTMYRISLDPAIEAARYESDSLLAACTQGTNIKSNWWFDTRVGVAWTPQELSLSMAEVIIVKKIKIGTWFETLWLPKDTSVPAMVPGMSFSFDLSFIGLESATFLSDFGWEIIESKPLVQIYCKI